MTLEIRLILAMLWFALAVQWVVVLRWWGIFAVGADAIWWWVFRCEYRRRYRRHR